MPSVIEAHDGCISLKKKKLENCNQNTATIVSKRGNISKKPDFLQLYSLDEDTLWISCE
jgi:hypothetical protein